MSDSSPVSDKIEIPAELALPRLPISIQNTRLITFDLDINSKVPASEQENHEPEFQIGAFLHDLEILDDFALAFVDFNITRNIKGVTDQEISGTYLISAHGLHDHDSWLLHFNFLASTAVWSKFSDLATLMMTQAALTWPRLPIKPPIIVKGVDIGRNAQPATSE